MGSSLRSWASWRDGATTIESGELSVATYDLGPVDGEPVTFLHGYPSSSLDVAPVAALLEPDWRVLTLDFPGFGASAKPPGHLHSIHAAADAVEALWAAAGVEATVLAAHDYGVSVGQELLARRGERALTAELTGVVWMNGGLYPDLHRPTLGQQMLLDPDHGAEVAAALDEATFIAGVRGTWGERVELDATDIGQIYASMDEAGGVAIMHELLHYIADRRKHADRWRQALEGSDLPTAFVWGDLDPVSGAHMIERVEERIGDRATIVRMADVGHWPPLEAPDVLADAIRAVARDAGAPSQH